MGEKTSVTRRVLLQASAASACAFALGGGVSLPPMPKRMLKGRTRKPQTMANGMASLLALRGAPVVAAASRLAGRRTTFPTTPLTGAGLCPSSVREGKSSSYRPRACIVRSRVA